MLQLKKNDVYCLNGFLLGWFNEDDWVPNQALVGSRASDDLIARLTGYQVSDGFLCFLGKKLAQVGRDPSGKIVSLDLMSAQQS